MQHHDSDAEGQVGCVLANRHPGKVLCVLWLGSSVGNLDPQEAGAFFKDVLRIGGPSTQVGVGAALLRDCVEGVCCRWLWW